MLETIVIRHKFHNCTLDYIVLFSSFALLVDCTCCNFINVSAYVTVLDLNRRRVKQRLTLLCWEKVTGAKDMNESAPTTTTQQSSLYHPVSPLQNTPEFWLYVHSFSAFASCDTEVISLSLMITSSSSISPIHQWSKAVSFFFPSGNVVTLYFPKISWAIGLKSQV